MSIACLPERPSLRYGPCRAMIWASSEARARYEPSIERSNLVSKPNVSGLPYRDALAELDDLPCTLVAQAGGAESPLVTIAIPTYQRLHFLVEAIESALAQDFQLPFEIVIVDNDPSSDVASALVERCPALRERNFRYYVNRDNIGMYRNHNRAIQLARGEWLTILNDDDLLDSNFLSLMFAEIDRHASIDGLASGKKALDQRSKKPDAPRPAQRATAHARATLRHGMTTVLYSGKQTRRITPRHLFWEPIIGNVSGFIFRKSSAEKIGGFYPEEHPSADYWFFSRFAREFHLRQHRVATASIRVAANESAKAETLKGFFQRTYELHQALAQGDVPSWWRHLSPYMIARHRVEQRDFWGIDVPVSEVEELLGVRLPRQHPHLLRATRLFLRAY